MTQCEPTTKPKRDGPLDLTAYLGFAGRVRKALEELKTLSSDFAQSMVGALQSIVIEGQRVDKVLRDMVLSMSSKILEQSLAKLSSALKKILDQLIDIMAQGAGSLLRSLFSGGSPIPFARGGVVASPTYFPMPAQGVGLAGEAGAEAILPLARGPDGSLGVKAGGGETTTVNVSIATQDVESFRRSESQVSAMLARAVGRGRRGL